MLAEGVFREFRDGANRLLRIADVQAFAATRFSDDEEQQESRLQVQAGSRPAAGHSESQEIYLPDIRLPLSGTAVLDAPVPRTGTMRRPAQTRQEGTSVHASADARRETCPSCRIQQPQPAPEARTWPGPRPERASVRKGLWMGVIEDRPFAIFALSALAVIAALALVAGVYILIEIL